MSGLKSFLKSFILVHLFFFYIFLASGLIVNFLQLISFLTVRWFSKRLYRIVNSYLAYCFWSGLTFLGQYWSGTTVNVYCDPENLKKVVKEHFICIMNHKYDIGNYKTISLFIYLRVSMNFLCKKNG